MADYRIYLLDAASKISSASYATCISDLDACIQARALALPGQKAEVWLSTRRVALVWGAGEDAVPGQERDNALLMRL